MSKPEEKIVSRSDVMQQQKSFVILVDKNDQEIGEMEKMEAHEKAMLHRAFSVFLFNNSGELLLHQRSAEKYHSAGLWTNACCSHPRPGEDIIESAQNRLAEEMGINVKLENAFTFIYKAEVGNGLTEYEYDHVVVGSYDGRPNPNAEEVKDWQWISVSDLNDRVKAEPSLFSAWFKIALPKMQAFIEEKKRT